MNRLVPLLKIKRFLAAKGDGTFFLQTTGNLIEKKLAKHEKLYVSPHAVLGFSRSMGFNKIWHGSFKAQPFLVARGPGLLLLSNEHWRYDACLAGQYKEFTLKLALMLTFMSFWLLMLVLMVA